MNTYYLEITSFDQIRDRSLPSNVALTEIEIDQPQFNKFLYQLVGSGWQWVDKLKLSDEQWQQDICRKELRTWVLYYSGAIAGYFELEKQANDVEVRYFGLAPEFIGQGLGGGLLSSALKHAWNWGDTNRIWVHTCDLDHPNALNNYKKAGFVHYRTQTT